MSERRPQRRAHWTDDLINAVIDLQYHCVNCMEDDYPDIDPRNYDAVNAAWVYDIIAVVEDWHRDRWTGVCESPEEVVRELKQAQAAMKRVREFLDDKDGQLSDEDRAKGCTILVDIGSVRRALDGDSDG